MYSIFCPLCHERIEIGTQVMSLRSKQTLSIFCESCEREITVSIEKIAPVKYRQEKKFDTWQYYESSSGCPGDCHECNECVF